MALSYTTKLSEDLVNDQKRISLVHQVDNVGTIFNVRLINVVNTHEVITSEGELFIPGATEADFDDFAYTVLELNVGTIENYRQVNGFQLATPGKGVVVVITRYSRQKIFGNVKNLYLDVDAYYVEGAMISGNNLVQYVP